MGVIQPTHEPAPYKPAKAEAGLENSKARGTVFTRRQNNDRRLEDGFLRTHTNAPQDNADNHAPGRVNEKNEDREKRSEQSGNNQSQEMDAVEQPAEKQGCESVHQHGSGVK